MDATLLALDPSLRTGHARMDDTHEEFLCLLAATRQAGTGAACHGALEQLLRHTEAHFAQEDTWLREIGFAEQNCHSMQHAQVLQALHEVARRAQAGDTEHLMALLDALDDWFQGHAATMDAGLAQMLGEAQSADPAAARPAPANPAGCGSVRCG